MNIQHQEQTAPLRTTDLVSWKIISWGDSYQSTVRGQRFLWRKYFQYTSKHCGRSQCSFYRKVADD